MFKKILLFVLALTLMLPVCSSFAEGKQPAFSDLANLEWTFSSGVGAWMTWFTMDAEGHFSGSFHDSEMGNKLHNGKQGGNNCADDAIDDSLLIPFRF